jgi:hypothetical protein
MNTFNKDLNNIDLPNMSCCNVTAGGVSTYNHRGKYNHCSLCCCF